MNGNLARSILCSLVTRVDCGWYSSIVGVGWLFCEVCSCSVIAVHGRASKSPANTETTMMRRVRLSPDFIGPLCFLDVRLIFPQEGARAPGNPLLESLRCRNPGCSVSFCWPCLP